MTVTNQDITPLVVEGIQDRKGKGITLIVLKDIHTAPAHKFVICQGSSTSQVSAIADSIREKVQQESGRKPFNYDGYRNSQWIVIDYGDTMVHVFLPDVRQMYRLEELWGDAKITQVPDLD